MSVQISPPRIAITGIDGAGKSTIAAQVTENLSRDLGVLEMSRPAFFVRSGVRVAYCERLFKAIDRLHRMADEKHDRKTILMVNSVNVLLKTRIVEPYLIRRLKPDLVINAREMLIDPAVYSSFYRPPVLESLSERSRLIMLQKVTGSKFSDLVFLLEIDPSVALTRIDSRIEEEAATGVPEANRFKFRHMHENLTILAQLSERYHTVLEAAQSLAPYMDVRSISVGDQTKDAIADAIEIPIRERLNISTSSLSASVGMA